MNQMQQKEQPINYNPNSNNEDVKITEHEEDSTLEDSTINPYISSESHQSLQDCMKQDIEEATNIDKSDDKLESLHPMFLCGIESAARQNADKMVRIGNVSGNIIIKYDVFNFLFKGLCCV